MRQLFNIAQYLAPIVGIAGIIMIVIGAKSDPVNWTLIQQSIPLVILSFIFKPRKDHPMAKLMGMDRRRSTSRSGTSRNDPLSTPISSSGEPALQDQTPEFEGAGSVDYHADQVKLVPLLPGQSGSGRSWIGGAPMLPSVMGWPQVNGSPSWFIAQIALEELPAGIWGGLGPREGWLAFFVPTEGGIDNNFQVFHFSGPVATRPWPEVDRTFYFGTTGDGARKVLTRAGLSVAPHPPRFSLEVQPNDRTDESQNPSVPAERPRAAIYNDYDPRSPEFRPFNRSGARALVSALIAAQARGIESQESTISNCERALKAPETSGALAAAPARMELAQKVKDSRLAAIGLLEPIAARLASEPNMIFGPAEVDDLLAELDNIRFQDSEFTGEGGGQKKLGAPRPVFDDYWFASEAMVAFEMMVKDAMFSDPDSVPEATRNLYEAVWRSDQTSEYLTMGGNLDGGFSSSNLTDPVFLLEVPSSDLVGWMWGDVSSLGVFISPADLANGRWDKAWGDIRHG